ncbi:MAG: radical SAM family heme chaperone HemW [Candidatus Zixiibacteriota bacterium]|nr:MAG: radical SAM family heme chaperone HemW [candidate division Zixibacteria bacterium]
MSFSLYLHYPFCASKCSYCDFYKEIYHGAAELEFFEALKTETRLAAENLGDSGRDISTIFIGGGTPSLINTESLADWLDLLRRHFALSNDLEFSIESNPESVTLENLRAFGKLGVNRPVFGIQSFNTKVLKILGREHNPHHSQRAIYYANALGFKNFGVDIIFGLPFQTSRMLVDDIDQIIDLDPPHISFYQLTVEEGTPLATMVRGGKVRLPDNELSLAMYKGSCQRFIEAGYTRYEVSSFAKPDFECRHNLSYWHGSDYLGLGPSAHSFINGQRFMNRANVSEYIGLLQKNELPRSVDKSGREERMTEAIMLGLRTAGGISREMFSQRFGVPLEACLDRRQYEMLVRSGHLIPEKGSLRLSDDGIVLADEITRRLIK